MNATDQPSLIVSDIAIPGVGTVRRITLNRPDKRNCLTIGMLERLAARIRGAADRVIMLAGSGSAFCSGLDHREFARAGSAAEHIQNLIEVLRLLSIHPRPTVSLIAGVARAGGVGLGCCVDMACASPRATFGIPYHKPYRPMVPVLIPIITARRDVSEDTVRALFGEELAADRVAQLGLVDLVSPTADDDALEKAALYALSDRGLLQKSDALRPLTQVTLDEVARCLRVATSPNATADLMEHLSERHGMHRPDPT